MRPLGPVPVHFVDVDAELARHPAHRRRRRRGRRFGRRAAAARRGARAAADVDDVAAALAARAPRAGASSAGRRLVGRRRSVRLVFVRLRSTVLDLGVGARRRPVGVGLLRRAGFLALRRSAAAARPSPALAAAACSAPAPPSSTLRIAWPTLTLSPALTLISLTVPATDDGTSIVALSVSSSRTGWSLASVSPALTSTRRTSPAAMFSPSSGSVKSVTKTSADGDRSSHGDRRDCSFLGIDVVRLDRLLRRRDASILPSRASAASVATIT